MVKVLIKKLDSSVKIPEYKTSGASAMDLMAFIKKPINKIIADSPDVKYLPVARPKLILPSSSL